MPRLQESEDYMNILKKKRRTFVLRQIKRDLTTITTIQVKSGAILRDTIYVLTVVYLELMGQLNLLRSSLSLKRVVTKKGFS